MKFIGIIIGSFAVVFAILAAAYFWGLAIPYQEFESEFLKNKPKIAYVFKDLNLTKQQIQKYQELIIWVDVHFTKDKHFAIINKQDILQNLPKEKNKVAKYDLLELRPIFPNVIELKTLLSELSGNRFIINVVDNIQDIHTELVKNLDSLNIDNRVLIQSDTTVVMTSIKEKKPMWLYGTSHPDIMRFLSFDSIGILPATPFKGDVYITPANLLNRNILKQSVFNEIKRRKKTILIGPINTKEEFLSARKFQSIDGFIFSDLSILNE